MGCSVISNILIPQSLRAPGRAGVAITLLRGLARKPPLGTKRLGIPFKGATYKINY